MTAVILLALCTTALAPIAQAQENPRAFSDTGYTVADDAIWTFFSRHGGTAVFGAPISREFTLYGSPVQLFEQAALQVRPDGGVQVMPLTGPGLLPYSHLGGLTVPGANSALTMVALGSPS